jgi:hypothetical protein
VQYRDPVVLSVVVCRLWRAAQCARCLMRTSLTGWTVWGKRGPRRVDVSTRLPQSNHRREEISARINRGQKNGAFNKVGFARGWRQGNTFRWCSGDEDAARGWEAVGLARPAATRVGSSSHQHCWSCHDGMPSTRRAPPQQRSGFDFIALLLGTHALVSRDRRRPVTGRASIRLVVGAPGGRTSSSSA